MKAKLIPAKSNCSALRHRAISWFTIAVLLTGTAASAFAGDLKMRPVTIFTSGQSTDLAQHTQSSKALSKILPVKDELRIWVKLLNGEMQSIRADQIWRLRPSFSRDEPKGATVLDFAFDRLYVSNSIDDIVEKIGGGRRLAQFTMPNGQPVYLVASKVIETFKAIRGQHHPEANTVVGTREGTQQIRESQEVAVKIITSADRS